MFQGKMMEIDELDAFARRIDGAIVEVFSRTEVLPYKREITHYYERIARHGAVAVAHVVDDWSYPVPLAVRGKANLLCDAVVDLCLSFPSADMYGALIHHCLASRHGNHSSVAVFRGGMYLAAAGGIRFETRWFCRPEASEAVRPNQKDGMPFDALILAASKLCIKEPERVGTFERRASEAGSVEARTQAVFDQLNIKIGEVAACL